MPNGYSFHATIASAPAVDGRGRPMPAALAVLSRPAASEADLASLEEKISAEISRMGGRPASDGIDVDTYLIHVPDDLVEKIKSDGAKEALSAALAAVREGRLP